MLHLIKQASSCIRSAWSDVARAPNLSDTEWLQSSLPLRLGGMGIKDPLVIAPAARIAAALTFSQRSSALGLPRECCVLPEDWSRWSDHMQEVPGSNAEPLRSWVHGVRRSEVVDDHLSQKWWTHRIHKVRFERLLRCSGLRDNARLQLQRMPHTTGWMTVTPNEGLGHKLDGRDYRYLIKWWLGRPLIINGASRCPCCEGPLDPLGDHLVTCKLNQPVQRHNALRDALTDALREKGMTCHKEVPIGGARRPADLSLPSLDSRGPMAIDLVIHHALGPSEVRGGDPRKSLKQAEEAKLAESLDLCTGNGWLFSPMAWHAWAGVGPYGTVMLARIEKAWAGDLQGWPRRRAIGEFRAKLSFALLSFIAKQLRVAEEALPGPQGEERPDVVRSRPGDRPFTEAELASWDHTAEEPLFVGPIRIRGRRPLVVQVVRSAMDASTSASTSSSSSC